MRNLTISLIFFLTTTILAAPLSAQIIRVDKNAPNGSMQLGDSWSNAYFELSDALNDILHNGLTASEVWVANGTYRPSYDLNGVHSGRDSTFALPAGLKLYGGFRGYRAGGPGEEQTLAERAGWFRRTRLSGDLNGTGKPDFGDVRHIVTMLSGSHPEETRLDGFVVEYSFAFDPNVPNGHEGGGIHAVQVEDLIITNCVIRNNIARTGGGAYILLGSAKISHCVFENNGAGMHGGGAYLGFVKTRNDPVGTQNSGIFNSTFRNNGVSPQQSDDMDPAAPGTGGGLYIENPDGPLHLANLVVHGNSASYGAGAFVNTRQAPSNAFTIWSNATFAYNRAQAVGTGSPGWGNNPEGGAIYFDSGSNSHEVRNLIVWANSATFSGADGIGVDPWAATTPDVRFSIVQSPVTASWGPENKSGALADPQFVSASRRNLRLAPNSPAIDQGENASLPLDWLDVDGDLNLSEELPWSRPKYEIRRSDDANAQDHPGILPGAPQYAPIVDIGAYERMQPITPEE